jgi:hypothetical protein
MVEVQAEQMAALKRSEEREIFTEKDIAVKK